GKRDGLGIRHGYHGRNRRHDRDGGAPRGQTVHADWPGAGRRGPRGPGAGRPRAPGHHSTGRRGGAAMSSTAGVLAVVLFVFFVVGVAVGIVVVIALSARRADNAERWNRRGKTPSGGSGYY